MFIDVARRLMKRRHRHEGENVAENLNGTFFKFKRAGKLDSDLTQ